MQSGRDGMELFLGWRKIYSSLFSGFLLATLLSMLFICRKYHLKPSNQARMHANTQRNMSQAEHRIASRLGSPGDFASRFTIRSPLFILKVWAQEWSETCQTSEDSATDTSSKGPLLNRMHLLCAHHMPGNQMHLLLLISTHYSWQCHSKRKCRKEMQRDVSTGVKHCHGHYSRSQASEP